MKTSLSSLDIKALVEELRPMIIGSWVNNIYNIGKRIVIIKFRKSSEVNFELVIELGKRFHVTKFVRTKPTAPSNKIAMARKHIKNLPVDDFYQVGLDRVIVFKIAFKDKYYKLVVELFGEGNLILVSPENKILLAYAYRRMRDRDVHPGRDFSLPPPPPLDITKLTNDIVTENLAKPEGKLVSVMNELLGLGPQYSKDIIKKANITSKTTSALTSEEKQRLTDEIFKLHDIIKNKQFKAYCYLDEEEIVEITPIPLARYDDLECNIIPSFSEALDEFFSVSEEEPEFVADKVEISGKLSKFEKMHRDQKKHKLRLEKQEIEEKRKGDLLYANFTVVDELLTTIVQARQSNIPWDSIQEKLQIGKEKGIASAQILEKINPKNKEVVIALLDEKNEKNTLSLDFTLSITDIANNYYEKAKKARRKIPGAELAMAKSLKMIEETKDKEDDLVIEVETKKMVEQRPKKWYEKFHWFICNERIIIGGTDAKTNERILKTYLDDDDLFFHADVHGAPYVVAKGGLNKVSEECISEIATFALSYSSLWKDMKLIGDVYNVSPEQVSLTAPSGQYIPKGGVMIYGTKNYSNNIEINHSLGLIIHNNYAQIIGGPSMSIQEKTELTIEIKPGDIPKGTMAKQLKQKFMEMSPEEDLYKVNAISVNEIMKFIPGNSDIIQ